MAARRRKRQPLSLIKKVHLRYEVGWAMDERRNKELRLEFLHHKLEAQKQKEKTSPSARVKMHIERTQEEIKLLTDQLKEE